MGISFNYDKLEQYMNNFTGEDSSRRRTSPPPQSSMDVPMASPTTSTGTSNMKRPGPSSPERKRAAKKHRGGQESAKVASRIDWMAPLGMSTAGAKPTTATSSQDPGVFIHVESSCMCFYP